MAAEAKQTCYEGSLIQNHQVYLEHSREHEAVLQCLRNILPGELKRCRTGADKSSLDVLGVGSGGGQLDVQVLSLLQAAFPAAPITADIVEGSAQLTDHFKALVAKTTNLQKIPFAWHFMTSENYEKEVKAKGAMKTFDLIHMVHVISYVDNLADTIRFYHSLLKNNGRLVIITGAANSGWDILWKTFKEELGVGDIYTSVDVTDCLKSQGLKYEEHTIPVTADISECFDPSSQTGERLLGFMTTKDHFYQAFTPEGCVLSLVLYTLFTHDCVTSHKDNTILEFVMTPQ